MVIRPMLNFLLNSLKEKQEIVNIELSHRTVGIDLLLYTYCLFSALG